MTGPRVRIGLGALSMIVAGLLFATCAHAHGVTLIVSRDAAEHPQLQVNGAADFRDGKRCVEMLKGDAMFAGSWIDDAPGISTLRRDGVTRAGLRLVSGHRVALKLLHADRGLAFLEPSTWNVVLAHAGDIYEFRRDPRGDFSIQMIARYDREGSPRAKFQFVDQAGLHKASKPFTLRFCTVLARDTTMLPRPIVAPQSYREAVAILRPRFHDAGGALAEGDLRRASDDGSAMRTLVAAIPSLARTPDSGVPVEAQAVVDSQAARALSAVADLQLASDLGDTLAAREHLEKLRVPVAAFEAYVPLSYTCPMGCENGKTYLAPGRCPVCGMRLSDTRAHADHTPKHGGVFMMSPDFAHHLEAALESSRELRVYVYDEFTDPLPADSVRARIVIDPASTGGSETSIALRRGPAPECLVAALPAGVRFPLHVTLVVDFRDGAGEESFDVQLARPSHSASTP